FKLYNYLMPAKDMVQTPVFPLEIPHHHMVYWTYADEFAEMHTKEMVTREAMKGFVPSAGVGTAFSRRALEMMSEKYLGIIFSTKSLVEDYDCALRLKLIGLKSIFLVQHIERVVLKKNIFGYKRPKKIKE